MRYRTIAVVVLAVAVAGSALYARWLRQARLATGEPEGEVALPTPEASKVPAGTTDPAPRPADVQATLDRLFEGALRMDRDVRPSFVTGDFSGDTVPDLAVAVRPGDGDAIPRLNAGLARWRIVDALSSADARPGERPSVAAGERLLAVVHGVAGAPWIGSGDQPCYLVRHAAGSGMRSRPLGALPPSVRMQVMRAHVGDVVARERGAVFWTGASYAWVELASAVP